MSEKGIQNNNLRKCHVPGCQSNSVPCKERGKMFSFPRNKAKHKRWKKICKITSAITTVRHIKICSLHFPETDLHTPQCRLMNLTEKCVCYPPSDPSLNLPGQKKAKERSWVVKKQKLEKELEHKKIIEELLASTNSDDCVSDEPHLHYELVETGDGEQLDVFSDSEEEGDSGAVAERHEWCPSAEEPAFSVSDLCRICAERGEESVQIFGDKGTTMQLQHKINSYLPLKVESSDSLPLVVCRRCVGRLEDFVALSASCVTADDTLKHMLQQQNALFQDNLESSLENSDDLMKGGEEITDEEDDGPLEDFEPTIKTQREVVRISETDLKIVKTCPQFYRTYILPDIDSENKTDVMKVCMECRQQFTSFTDFWEHTLLSHGPYACELHRREKFESVNDIEWHRKFCKHCVCVKCGEKFARHYEFIQHFFTSHTDDMPYCKICGTFCVSDSDLKRHKEKHMNDACFQCLLCHKKFLLTVNFYKHFHEKCLN